MAQDNKMNDFPYTKDELLCLGIYELRDLGRDIGVPSPTTMKKEELVDMILAIIYGEAPKRRVGKGRGRPARNKPKPNRSFIDLVNKIPKPEENDFISDGVDPIVYVFPNNMYLTSKVSSSSADYVVDGVESSNVKLQSGVVSIKNGVAFLRKAKYFNTPYDLIIPQSLVEEYGLQDGDLVEYLEREGKNVVSQIIKINGELAIKVKVGKAKETIESKDAVCESLTINEEVEIQTLKSNLIFALNSDKRQALVDKISDVLIAKGYNVVNVRFDINKQRASELTNPNKVEFVADSFGDEYETMALIEAGVERINYYEALEMKSVLIVDNLPWLMSVIETYPKSVYGTFFQKLVRIPKAKNSKATVICLSSYMSDQELIETSAFFDNVCLKKEEKSEFEKELFINRKNNK